MREEERQRIREAQDKDARDRAAPPSVRVGRAEAVARLRAEGKTQREIAAELGISRTYVAGLLADPDGSVDAARKLRYKVACAEGCGALVWERGARCPPCAVTHSRYWQADRIIEAIQLWAEQHGEQPAATDWLQPTERGWPGVNTVQQRFGSWSEGLRAAGFESETGRYRPKRQRRGDRMKARQWVVLVQQEAMSSWEVLGEVEAGEPIDALNALVANGKPPAAYAALPKSAWQPKHVRPVERVVLVEETQETPAA